MIGGVELRFNTHFLKSPGWTFHGGAENLAGGVSLWPMLLPRPSANPTWRWPERRSVVAPIPARSSRHRQGLSDREGNMPRESSLEGVERVRVAVRRSDQGRRCANLLDQFLLGVSQHEYASPEEVTQLQRGGTVRRDSVYECAQGDLFACGQQDALLTSQSVARRLRPRHGRVRSESLRWALRSLQGLGLTAGRHDSGTFTDHSAAQYGGCEPRPDRAEGVIVD